MLRGVGASEENIACVNARSAIGALWAVAALACLLSCLASRPTAPDHDGSASGSQGGAGGAGMGGSMSAGGSRGGGAGGPGSGGKAGTGGAGAGGSGPTPAYLTITGSGGAPASAVVALTVTASFAITNTGQQTSGALTYALSGDSAFSLGLAPADACINGMTSLSAGASCIVQVVFQPAAVGPVETQISVTWVGSNVSNSIKWDASGVAPASGSFHEFMFPGSHYQDIKQGSDGNLWIADYGYASANRIVRMTPVGGATFFQVPTPNAGAVQLVLGPDGNIWFTETNAGQIGSITPSGTIMEFICPSAGATPSGTVTDPDGNLWYADRNATIGRITPKGQITEFSVPGAAPVGITSGPDRNLWFADQNGSIGRVTTAGVITMFPVPSPNAEDPQALAFGSDGNIWYTNINMINFAPVVGRMTTAGFATEFLCDGASLSNSIVGGPDGNVWFTVLTDEVVRITPDGTQMKIPVSSHPVGISVARDGNIWVAENEFILRYTP